MKDGDAFNRRIWFDMAGYLVFKGYIDMVRMKKGKNIYGT
jgi:hypothetical protein